MNSSAISIIPTAAHSVELKFKIFSIFSFITFFEFVLLRARLLSENFFSVILPIIRFASVIVGF